MNKLILAATLIAVVPLSFAEGLLENPVVDITESGIGVISGWHCTATRIDIVIDGLSVGKAGSGTSRNDTTGICGRSDSGYSLLYNYNILSPGSHTISAYADGEVFETRQFNTVQSGGEEYLRGISKTATISDFPSLGRIVILQWSQAKQSFVITGISAATAAAGAAAN